MKSVLLATTAVLMLTTPAFAQSRTVEKSMIEFIVGYNPDVELGFQISDNGEQGQLYISRPNSNCAWENPTGMGDLIKTSNNAARVTIDLEGAVWLTIGCSGQSEPQQISLSCTTDQRRVWQSDGTSTLMTTTEPGGTTRVKTKGLTWERSAICQLTLDGVTEAMESTVLRQEGKVITRE